VAVVTVCVVVMVVVCAVGAVAVVWTGVVVGVCVGVGDGVAVCVGVGVAVCVGVVAISTFTLGRSSGLAVCGCTLTAGLAGLISTCVGTSRCVPGKSIAREATELAVSRNCIAA